MNWESAGVLVALVTVFISVVGHAITMSWWGSRITVTVENLNRMIDVQNKEFLKRDEQLAKLWDKHDNLKDRVTILESK